MRFTYKLKVQLYPFPQPFYQFLKPVYDFIIQELYTIFFLIKKNVYITTNKVIWIILIAALVVV